MQCDCFITYLVKVAGTGATTCDHALASGAIGPSVIFDFVDSNWDEVPIRTAAFWAGDMRVYGIPIVDNTATIPPEILSRPCVPLYVGVVGKDCEPDAESIARAEEIKLRQSQILEETPGAEPETVRALMDEYMALHYEMDGLNLVKKCYPSNFCRLGFIYPGTTMP